MADIIPSFTLTNDSISIAWRGKTYNIRKGSPQFGSLKSALVNERWEDVPKYLTIGKSIESWAKGRFTIQNGDTFLYKGEQIPQDINKRVIEMATNGEDPTVLFNFWERLQKNPSYRSVKQLFPFLQHEGIPFTRDGCFLAYKSVKMDYKDHQTGTFDNHPGAINQLDRNKVSDDPTIPCHEGFHVGAYAYASTFNAQSRRVVVCKVAPEDVVCIPHDSGQQKMRVCKYRVIGLHNGELLSSTVFDDAFKLDEEGDVVDQIEAGAEAENDDVTKVEEKPVQGEEKPSTEKRAPAKGFTRFNKMGLEELMKESMTDLRKYAGKGLKIVGASKIPGGKVSLVTKILEIRE